MPCSQCGVPREPAPPSCACPVIDPAPTGYPITTCPAAHARSTSLRKSPSPRTASARPGPVAGPAVPAYIAPMNWYLEILLLALIQGAAELLPVSSSAHVILAERLLGLDPAAP